MISRQELLELATQYSLRPDVVEKDYVLGWLLAGIGQHSGFRDTWIFKGGTCLKKCFFETYRFSEDLDFTIIKPDVFDSSSMETAFNEIADWIYDQTGLECPAESRIFEMYEIRGKPAAQCRIPYRGPLAPRGDLPKIRLDLTNDESVVLPPDNRTVYRPYSDCNEIAEITTYAYAEIFAEKIRALSERLRPRDLYDVIHLYRNVELIPDPQSIRKVLDEKCKYKNIPFPTIESLKQDARRTELEAEWDNMLAHQLPTLPPFTQFWEALPEVFDWLTEVRTPTVLPWIVEEEEHETELDTIPQPVSGATSERMYIDHSIPRPRIPGIPNRPLEIIRFAGANRLCVLLGYKGTKRLIEPYSLRRTKDNNVLLHSIRVNNGEHRAYRLDKIESAELTQKPFKPKYTIELTATGAIYAPPQSSSRVRRRSRSSLKTRYRSPSRKYIFRCTVCGKKFTRKRYNNKLNEHKNKHGNKCYGRFGIYEGSKWE